MVQQEAAQTNEAQDLADELSDEALDRWHGKPGICCSRPSNASGNTNTTRNLD